MFSTFLKGNGETLPKKIYLPSKSPLRRPEKSLPTQNKLKKGNFNMFLIGDDEALPKEIYLPSENASEEARIYKNKK